ncbi:PREDICTED: uncharacterized protein LOC106744581 isoform X2 [Dinoponera quadriceps]|uniref:Uncharacterized protein LOC106744581 isoform X2 n=1 Tax=Dinoponera quadriceps TaxID=609295 RepID=A0A6P3X9P5_DINQU|nr:PREDICTED: uncharacterized protein LOC106744581 isoform X2 [Dinoponera quadriceps]
MNSRRRRADNFTDSLFSFRQTSDTEYSQASQMYSEDSLDTDSVINRQCGSDKHNCPNNIKCHRDSIILASNSTKEQYVSSSDAYHTAEESSDTQYSDIQHEPNHILNETSYIPIKFDLNKCINLFHNEYLEKESGTCEEYSSISTTSSKTNVKEVDPCYLNTGTTVEASNHEKVETIVPSVDAISLSESPVSSNKKDDLQSMEEDQKYDLTSGGSTVEDIDPCELKTLLHSLENQQKPPREMLNQEQMLRRLSTIFYISPSDFTERLLTIIEESVIINDSDTREFPDVSLRRLTAELRQMCKFIDNETVPEWPASPGTSICEEGDGQPKPDSSRRSLGILLSPRKSLCIVTPISSTVSRSSKSPRKIFRRTPKTISAALDKTQSPSYESTNVHDSTSTFECLEAYCKRLFPDEYRPSPQQKNHLQSPLRNMNNILHKCSTQMASLEDSFGVREPVRNVATSTSDPASQHNTTPETSSFQYDLIVFTPDKPKKILSKSVSPMQRAECQTRCEIIEPDDLQKTLIYEIAKKRQRCLNTAKVIMEINGSSEPLEAQGTCPISSVNEARLSTEKDVKLMETLMSCKKYQEYLEEYRPLLNLLQRSESYKSRPTQSKKDARAKEANKVNVATLTAPKSSITRGTRGGTSRSPSPKIFAVPKPKLFITPGKTPAKRTVCREKRTYFRNAGVSPIKQENLKKSSNKEPDISPCAQSICRKMGLNYDSVISPVGMYIKGTNPHLIKNLRPKTDEMLLTPRRKQHVPSVNTKPEMKFRLSPKQPKKTLAGTAARDENVPDNFLHPKVHYKLPSHVRTIKETENRKVGNRINELLRATQDKVVIRHEGRTKTVQTDCSEQPEIHYDSAEESVHIEQTARKTHFSRVQKGY